MTTIKQSKLWEDSEIQFSEETEEVSYKIKMYQIWEGIYQRGRFHKFPKEIKLSEFEKREITMIAGLVTNPDKDLFNVEPFFYWNYPIADGKLKDETIETLLEYSFLFASQIKKGKILLTYCNAGRNRSSLFNALVLMRLSGFSGVQAIEHIRSIRKNALANEYFVKFLEDLKL